MTEAIPAHIDIIFDSAGMVNPADKLRIEKELGIKPTNVMINASHCHGVVCSDVDERTFQAVKAAAANLVPVKVGVGVGHEDRTVLILVQLRANLMFEAGTTIPGTMAAVVG